jgi:hypothetical protein
VFIDRASAFECVRFLRGSAAYPFLWFFFDWLCWDEFLDSARLYQYNSASTTRDLDVLAIATVVCVESSGWCS